MIAAFARFACRKPARVFLALLVSFLVLSFLAPNGANGRAQAAPPEPPAALSSPTSTGPYACVIRLIWVTSTSTQVECTQAPTGVIFFFAASVDAASTQSTNRMLALITTAYALGKPINVYYTADSASNPPGCFTGTCRRLDGVNIEP